ncbi:hypothetical protein BG015_007675 [Linnemannia schmuckeri]|uniref:Uncharacterized protein n=1 Tax=Linnemannia schmuckeri TaxID=64567 RepID=A0A9P5VB44_9FUNG|nr:hypothetical protein BG015_007675 [Linnemannia schmuckeri]
MNARSRWKIEYLRTKSSSPADSVVEATVGILPELLKKGGGAGDNNDNVSHQDTSATQPTLEDTISVAPAGPTVEEVTMEEQLPTTTEAAPAVVNISEDTRLEQEPTLYATKEGAIVEEKPEIDPIEQDILLQLEELKKEKSRLFALFRSLDKAGAVGSATI